MANRGLRAELLARNPRLDMGNLFNDFPETWPFVTGVLKKGLALVEGFA
jgi:hypothetical protein